LNSYIIVSRWTRNTIDLITGLSCLFLGNNIAKRSKIFNPPSPKGSFEDVEDEERLLPAINDNENGQ
jgi:hypothetical protein